MRQSRNQKKRRMAAMNAKDAKRDPQCRGAIHRALISTAVFVGCASRTGQSRNISRKDAKAAKVGKYEQDDS
jgi:hypothetical protein